MIAWLRTLASRVVAAAARGRLDREFDDELDAHLELLIDEYRRTGLSPGDARAAAIRKLGRPLALREDHRWQRGLPVLDVVVQDLRYACRRLGKNPVFTALVTLSLALGIGSSTALFSLIDALLLRSLPVRAPYQLFAVQQTTTIVGIRKVGNQFPALVFDAARTYRGVLADVAGFNDLDAPLIQIDGDPSPDVRRQVERISSGFFQALGVSTVVGRAPTAADEDVAVIAHSFWRSRFQADPDVLGQRLAVDGRSYTIVGVAPPRFAGVWIERPIDVWVSSRDTPPQQMLVRLTATTTLPQAHAALQGMFAQLGAERPEQVAWSDQMQVELMPAGQGLSQLRAAYARPLLALTGLVVLVLLITCANAGSLIALRDYARRREVAVRYALGARRGRLIAQYLIESVVIALVGGSLGLLVARWGVSILLSMLPLSSVPDALAFHPGLGIVVFAGGGSLLTALLIGLAPALRATQIDLAAALGSSRSHSPSRNLRRLGRALVGGQVGLSVCLLAGAGLFVQTLRNYERVDLGLDLEGVLQVSLNTSGYQPLDLAALSRRLVERVSAVPGVTSVATTRNALMRERGLSRTRFSSLRPGQTLGPDDSWDSVTVGPTFFDTMRIPIVRGRGFTASDVERGKAIVIVNEAFARHYFGADDPTVGESGEVIVGVARDARIGGPRRDTAPLMYFLSLPTNTNRLDALEVRIAGDAAAAGRAIREAVQGVHPKLFVDATMLRQEIDRSLARERLVATISGFFSVLTLALASIGVFGIAMSSVGQRTNELGIRMALGASRGSMIRESLAETAFVLAAGLATGLVASIVAIRLIGRFISGLLFGLEAIDPLNLAGAALLMLAVAAAACVVPAHRATRIDPLAAIRHE